MGSKFQKFHSRKSGGSIPSQIGACHRQATPAWSPRRVYEPLGSPQERPPRQRQTPPTPWPSCEQALGLWPLARVFCPHLLPPSPKDRAPRVSHLQSFATVLVSKSKRRMEQTLVTASPGALSNHTAATRSGTPCRWSGAFRAGLFAAPTHSALLCSNCKVLSTAQKFHSLAAESSPSPVTVISPRRAHMLLPQIQSLNWEA